MRKLFSSIVNYNFRISKKEDYKMDCKHRRMDSTTEHTGHKGIYSWLLFSFDNLQCRNKLHNIVFNCDLIVSLFVKPLFQEFLESSLSTQVLDTLFVRIMEIIVGTSVSDGGGARNHDILAAFMTILITNKTVKLILPSCLRTNEQIRLHALSTVYKNLDRQNDEQTC